MKIAIYAGTGSGSAVAWYSITVEDALDSTVQVSANSAPAGRWVTVTDAKGLMNGTSETAFAPDGITTRAETAAVLMRLLEQIK